MAGGSIDTKIAESEAMLRQTEASIPALEAELQEAKSAQRRASEALLTAEAVPEMPRGDLKELARMAEKATKRADGLARDLLIQRKRQEVLGGHLADLREQQRMKQVSELMKTFAGAVESVNTCCDSLFRAQEVAEEAWRGFKAVKDQAASMKVKLPAPPLARAAYIENLRRRYPDLPRKSEIDATAIQEKNLPLQELAFSRTVNGQPLAQDGDSPEYLSWIGQPQTESPGEVEEVPEQEFVSIEAEA